MDSGSARIRIDSTVWEGEAGFGLEDLFSQRTAAHGGVDAPPAVGLALLKFARTIQRMLWIPRRCIDPTGTLRCSTRQMAAYGNGREVRWLTHHQRLARAANDLPPRKKRIRERPVPPLLRVSRPRTPPEGWGIAAHRSKVQGSAPRVSRNPKVKSRSGGPRSVVLAVAVAEAVTYRMRELDAPPALRPPAKPTLWSFARALWSSGQRWVVWPMRAASVVVSLGGGVAVFLAPTIRWPLTAAIAFFLLVIVGTAGFLLWRTEVLKAERAYETLRPRFRIVPAVAESEDSVRAVVEVVNESPTRIHNLRVAVVDAYRLSREPVDREPVGIVGVLPQEGPAHFDGPPQQELVTLDGGVRFDLAVATKHREGVFQCAQDRREERRKLLPEGGAYVFRVEAAADDVPRVEELLELHTTIGGPVSKNAYGHAILRDPMPSFVFVISSDTSPTRDGD